MAGPQIKLGHYRDLVRYGQNTISRKSPQVRPDRYGSQRGRGDGAFLPLGITAQIAARK
jgi:hypothetical protein